MCIRDSCYIAGYRIAGKTGTSQKLDQKPTEDGQVAQEEHILSFVGIAPADDPQIAVLVILDTPEISNVLGSTIAAPVVKYIMEDTLPYLGIEPKYTAEELEKMCIRDSIMTHTATAAILLPIIVFIAGDIGFDPRAAAMIVVIFTNVTYSTPIMTPAATLTLQAGYRFRDYIRVGGLLNVISYLATVALLPLLFEF